ncbi:MAG: LamG domain-containing protein [Opitutaceae bacterium]|jgi:hypothetical protein|nr:LamG domain-containing protein [Opitutaceae bacterium]
MKITAGIAKTSPSRCSAIGIFSTSIVCLFACLSGLVSVNAQLVFHYEFNETSGVTVSDSAGNHDLALRSSSTWGAGVNSGTGGLALKATASGTPTAGAAGSGFTGDDVINLTKYTITGWYQVSGTPSGHLLTLGNSMSGSSFRIVADSGNAFLIYTQGRTITSTTSGIISGSPGKWVFLAITIDTTLATPGVNWANVVKVYVASEDSVDLTQVTNKGLSGSASVADSALAGIDTIVLGNNTATVAGSSRAFNSNALLDDIRLYSGVLDATALNEIRLQSIPIPEPKSVTALAGCGAIAATLLLKRRAASAGVLR